MRRNFELRKGEQDISPTYQDIGRIVRQAEERELFLKKSRQDLMASYQELKAKQEASSNEIKKRTDTIDRALRYGKDMMNQDKRKVWDIQKFRDGLKLQIAIESFKKGIEACTEISETGIKTVQKSDLNHTEKMGLLNEIVMIQKKNMEASYLSLDQMLSRYKEDLEPMFDQAVKTVDALALKEEKEAVRTRPYPSIDARASREANKEYQDGVYWQNDKPLEDDDSESSSSEASAATQIPIGDSNEE